MYDAHADGWGVQVDMQNEKMLNAKLLNAKLSNTKLSRYQSDADAEGSEGF